MRSVTVPRGVLRPSPPDVALKCLGCQASSRWLLRTKEDDVELCAPCVLYASPLVDSFEDLPSLITEVEATMGRVLTRDDQGQLCGQDADRIVFAICVVSNGAPKPR